MTPKDIKTLSESISDSKFCISLTFDIELPTLNSYIDQERSNKFTAAKLKKKTTETISKLTLRLRS